MNFTDVLADDYFSRSNLINYLIGLYGYKSYLEIGVDIGANFEQVICDYKVGVDPANKYEKLTYNITSDEFFESNKDTFDIVFIDGLHISEQVVKDIQNSLDILNPKGTIIMHDCLPNSESAQSRERLGDHWNGDVWKAFAHYRKDPDLTMFTVNTDQGLGFIKKGSQDVFHIPDDLEYSYFVQNAKEMMRIVSVSYALEAIKELHRNNF
jgi:hypothetical protein